MKTTDSTPKTLFITTNDQIIDRTIPSGEHLDANALVAIRDYVNRKIENLSKNPLYQHKCINCGATVELNYEKGIFICPYCGSHYAINTNRINDIG